MYSNKNKMQKSKMPQKMTRKVDKFFVSFQGWWPWWPVIGVFLLLTSCMLHNGQSMNKEIEYTGEGFSIKIPPVVQVEKKSPMGEFGDFHLYYFSIDQEHFLTAYIGNAPIFCEIRPEDTKIKTGFIKTGLINNMPFKRAELKGLNSYKRVEVLIRFPNNEWPGCMHFAYDDIPSNLESTAEKIINSIKEKKTRDNENI